MTLDLFFSLPNLFSSCTGDGNKLSTTSDKIKKSYKTILFSSVKKATHRITF